jgi:hypothetical protein
MEFVLFLFYVYVIMPSCIISGMHLADRTEAVSIMTSGSRFVTLVTQSSTFFMPPKNKDALYHKEQCAGI